MPVIKLTEPYAVSYMREMVRDSCRYHGEEAVLLRLYHPEFDKDIQRCPRCFNDSYMSGEEVCPVCYGTTFYDDTTQTGGVKEAYRAWCVFTDHIVVEKYDTHGVVAPDQRQVTTTAFPMLVQNDVIVRVKCWDPQTHTALSGGEFYRVAAVTRQSLRTGAQFGQTREDVVGQSAQVALLPHNSIGITRYPIQGVSFPHFTITGTTAPTAIGQPDDQVIYIPVPGSPPQPNYGYVSGAELEWNPVFTFVQQVATTPWLISHTLDHYPSVNITVNGMAVDGDVSYPSPTTVQIDFASPQAGTAELT